MKGIKSVQIIGTQRSGSNLLRLMLNQVEGVFAPHPPHILSTFFELLPGYGTLENDDNFRLLIDDICTLIELNPVRWESLFADRKKIFNSCQNRSLTEIFRVIYELNSISHDADTWICKSMQNVKYLEEFERIGFAPKMIFLYRDGRDVALSFQKAIVGPKHIYSIAKKWSSEQEMCFDAIKRYGESQVLSLSYESLLRSPEKQIMKVCHFLDMKYNEKVLDYYTSDESLRTAEAGEMWTNLRNPIIKNNTKKYINGLSNEEIRIFELIAGRQLKRLGYKLENNFATESVNFSKSEIHRFEKANERVQIEVRNKASINDLRRRGAQDDFVAELKKRLNIKAA